MRRAGLPVALVVSSAVLLLAGCGAETTRSADPSRTETPAPTPLARIAVAEEVKRLDPLYARTAAERLISRQIYDPLVFRADPPLGAVGSRRGPARPVGPERGGTLWRFALRPDARFQDGVDVDPEAVAVNVERWLASGVAADLLPELDAVDSPLPGIVRFQLSAPVPDLPLRLSDPRLGLVSPAALLDGGLGEVERGAGGSGAYEPRLVREDRVVLSASGDWWGRTAGLGPGIARLEFLAEPSATRRSGLLADGVIEIAYGLGGSPADLIARDPLLTTVEQGGSVTGASAAVRGLQRGAGEQPLSETWLTLLR